MHSPLVAQDHRRAPRDDVAWRTHVHGPRIRTKDALVLNISPYGCMVRSSAIASPYEAVTVELPVVGQSDGHVVWALGGKLGIEFSCPVALRDYMPLLGQMQSIR